MTRRKNCANSLEVARAELAAVGEQLDRLEVIEPWTPELEDRRQALWKRYAAARRAVEAAELEEQLDDVAGEEDEEATPP